MNNNSVIVYRSQSEANIDWFLQECVGPWIYNHFWHIVLAGFVACALFYIKTRFDRR